MSYRNKWVEETIEALIDLGGHATLNEIYIKVEVRNKINLEHPPKYGNPFKYLFK